MKSPAYSHPPLHETVIALQYDPLPRLTSAHLGAYWASLGSAWGDVSDAPALGPITEPLGPGPTWMDEESALDLPAPPSIRIRAMKDTKDRVLQLENGWIVYNWRKRDASAEYSRYDAVLSEFEGHVDGLASYLNSLRIGAFRPNLWEVAYINFIEQGQLWQSIADWHRVVPGLVATPTSGTAEMQTMSGQWVRALDDGRARLHVLLEHGRSTDLGSRQLMIIKLIARGSILDHNPDAWKRGVQLGHDSIIHAFEDLTSPEAKSLWRGGTH